ncbi:glycosyl transferase family protein [Hephaestia sp. GCM10023244]|uniref:glycosyl transferase family protein n=1 Tax=unclassified Hephaestia TaxID=2631281 RepID=UPI0020777265|nr:glycosyl transferase family protein [Hephaestia sp. MAHUQ-44]
MDWGWVVWGLDAVVREAMLFAAVGFLIGGIDDLAIDAIFFVRTGWRRATVMRRYARARLADFVVAQDADRLVIFVAAWDESRVIGAMLDTALARIDHPNYRLYVGVYPNDRATIDAVAEIAAGDGRVRLVIGPRPGPTTKADCLNALWRALLRDETAEGGRAKAVVLHDAEDVVHAGELAIFDRLIDRHWVVQLPVLPLPDQCSRFVSGHYLDEFSEAHTKQLVVREALGAGLPLAGVGCAIARAALDAIATLRGGVPFDESSLTEDYEFGLRVGVLGGSGILARIPEYPGGPVVAVRAYFPATLDAAVRQKARWLVGIALAGWDRTGWGQRRHLGERWMRMRDRRAPLAVLVLAAAYFALVVWGAATALHWSTGIAPPRLDGMFSLLLSINAILLVWRLAMRVCFTGLSYGRREALWALPRAFVGNVIAMFAVRRAIWRYLGMLAGRAPRWDKTAHHFPTDDATEPVL